MMDSAWFSIACALRNPMMKMARVWEFSSIVILLGSNPNRGPTPLFRWEFETIDEKFRSRQPRRIKIQTLSGGRPARSAGPEQWGQACVREAETDFPGSEYSAYPTRLPKTWQFTARHGIRP